MKLLIKNEAPCHYEIIESIIIKHRDILNLDSEVISKIYLRVFENPEFQKYIHLRFPFVVFDPNIDYDYCIDCTVYDSDFDNLNSNLDSKTKYISHEISERLKHNPNVYFLTPLAGKNFIYADQLPFMQNKINYQFPIFIVQGHLNQNRRCLKLLAKILENDYKYDYIIKLIGEGDFPKELEPYKSKITLKNNLNFIDFHKEFINAYSILPLISKQENPRYYVDKLTSSINYSKAYNLKCLIDRDLQSIYNLDNVMIYQDHNDISEKFAEALENFYIKKNN